jgi:demethylmenaquinone methyltransferase/2-methoxy-6-polyprenyl-1,4-benzoquinol methylase
VLEYYDRRAKEYDEWYLGAGLFADRDRPGWDKERDRLCRRLGELSPARTLDVACGTGFLTRHLPGEVTGLDQSGRMLTIARERVPSGRFVQGDALGLPFADGSFERVVTGHFYGHLREEERRRFLAEAARVAGEVVVVDSHERPDHATEEEQERVLNDGSRHTVYKRYFTGERLAAELGGADVLLDGDWFVVVKTRCSRLAEVPASSGTKSPKPLSNGA